MSTMSHRPRSLSGVFVLGWILAAMGGSTGCAASAPPPPATPPVTPESPPEEAATPAAPPPAEVAAPTEPAFTCPAPPGEVPPPPAKGPRIGLVLVLDRSRSMDGPALDKAKEAAKSSLKLLGADDWLSVIGFDAEPEAYVKAQPVVAKSRIQIGIMRMGVHGKASAVGPALDLAREQLGALAGRREHVVIVTDGDVDQAGADAALALARTGATISTLALGEEHDRARLECLARVGGGRTVFLESPDAIGAAFKSELDKALAP